MTAEDKSVDATMPESSSDKMVETTTTSVEEAVKGVEEVKTEEKKIDSEAPPPSGDADEKKVDGETVEEKKTDGGEVDESDSAVLVKKNSFKEESSNLSDLREYEKRALNDLKAKVEDAILHNKIFKEKPKTVAEEKKEIEKPKEEEGEKKVEEKEVTIEEVKKPDEGTEKEKEKAVEEVKEATEEKEKEKAVEEVKEPIPATEEKATVVEEKEKSVDEEVAVDKDISLWGIPLLPSKGVPETDVVLLKFLRARDFRVSEALEMLMNTLRWRKAYKSDSLLEEEFNSSLNSVAFMDGFDREGHPICFNVYGSFQNNDLYQKTFGTEEQRQQFLRWRVQLMEKGIQKLDFSPGGVCSLLQINDLKNTPGPAKKELRVATKQAVALLQDNYPEFVTRNIFINVPFWYYAFNALLSPFLTQRTKSKFVFARPSSVSETLLKYIPADQIPTKYGGFKRENETEFTNEQVCDLIVRSGATESVEILVPEVGTTILWDLSVFGWEVTYKEEFVPSDEGSYTVIVQKARKYSFTEEPTRNSFRNNEPGKIVLTVENGSFKKKRILYRYKVKESSSSS